MATIVISIDRTAFPAHTDADFKEWLDYNVQHSGSISLSNPLCDVEFEGIIKEIRNTNS